MIERELKLAAAPSFALPSLNGAIEGATASPPEQLRLETTYYDTPELRLSGWDCALRFRKGEGWTVKLPSTLGAAGQLERPELVFQGEAYKVPDQARSLLLAYIRRSPLQPVATLSTIRTRVRLHDASGRLIAEIVDDDVSVINGLKVARRQRQLEIELGEAGDDRTLAMLHRHLHEAGAGPPETISKLAMALAGRMPVPPEVALPVLSSSPTIGELLRHAIAENAARLFRSDPGVRLGSDPEDIHQARVATRRLRSQLRSFAPLFEADWRKELRGELQWIARSLGEVRDRQVMARRFTELGRELPERDQRAIAELGQRASVESEEKRARLVLDMRTDRYLDLLDRLVQAARSPAFVGDLDHDALEAGIPLVRREWRRLRKLVRALPPDPAAPQLHRVRIQAKQVRYAAEAMIPVADAAAQRFADAAADLQDVLGEHQDSINAQRWLQEAGQEKEAFVAGALFVMEGEAAARVRARWGKVWKSVRRRKIRRWMMI